MKVTQEPIPLEDLLTKYTSFKIPEYQREYSWEIEQISDLFYDIENSEEDQGYFLGSLLIYSDDTMKGNAEIIDGQQRLATLFLMLNSIKRLLQAINDSESVEQLKNLLYKREKSFIKKKKSDDPKLIIGNRDNSVFRALLRDEDHKIVANKKIKSHKLLLKASEDFFSIQMGELQKNQGHEGLLKFLDKIVKTEFIVMTAEKKYDKILLFKTLNVRGLELSQSDLIKNEICRNPKGISVEEAVDLWDDIKSSLEECKAKIDIFLFHYINSLNDAQRHREQIDKSRNVESKKQYAPFIPEKYVFDVFELKLQYTDSTGGFLNEIKNAADNYKLFILPNDNIYLAGLRAMNITKCYPLLLRGKKVLNKKNFSKLAQALEIISFRHSITRQDPKELEKLYYKLLTILKSDNDIKSVLDEISSHPTIKNINKFKEEFIIASPKNIVSKYILFRLASKLQEGLSWGSKEVHLEHIMPQRPKNNWLKLKNKDAEVYNDYISRIGNHTLLRDKLNQAASNNDFASKKNEYKKSGLKINNSLLNYNKWTFEMIEKRQSDIYEDIKNLWSI